MQKYLVIRTSDGDDKIEEFLHSLGIKTERVHKDPLTGFSRHIQFQVYGVTYTIQWYANLGTLVVGDTNRGARIPFNYLYLDKSFPIHGDTLAFPYEKVTGIKYRVFPYELFRIPLELKESSK